LLRDNSLTIVEKGSEDCLNITIMGRMIFLIMRVQEKEQHEFVKVSLA